MDTEIGRLLQKTLYMICCYPLNWKPFALHCRYFKNVIVGMHSK